MSGWTTPGPTAALDERMQALEDAADAADAALDAPSVHGSHPWTLVLHRDLSRAPSISGLLPVTDGREGTTWT